MLVPDKVSAGVLLLARRILQLGGESDARTVEGWTVAGQVDLGLACTEVSGKTKKLPLLSQSQLTDSPL